MSEWSPISLVELNELISSVNFDDETFRFWQLIKVEPTKWSESTYGDEGGGFWVVGIFGSSVLWYNDIEEGFNISLYTTFGRIDEYACNQDELNWPVARLLDYIKTARKSGSNRREPVKLSL